MQARFLLGPAGSGKTFRCLAEIRAALTAASDGPPLILLAPKQATFQLERQLLADPALSGYARLHILSFERLAEFVLKILRVAPPRLLSEQGRVMVLRALLLRHEMKLELFRKSASRPGFAQQLSQLLAELQRHHFTAARLQALAQRPSLADELRGKLHDLALLLEVYTRWLNEHELQDANRLLATATAAITAANQSRIFHHSSRIGIENPESKAGASSILQPKFSMPVAALWLDGFAEMTPAEMDLLAAVLPWCGRATLAFCLEDCATQPGDTEASWLSLWTNIRKTYQECRRRVEALDGCEVVVEKLPRDPQRNRFGQNPVLQHLEAEWANPAATRGRTGFLPSLTVASEKKIGAGLEPVPPTTANALRVVACSDPEAEATFAAREILRFVRRGGRFREAAILVRDLDLYHKPLERAFRRYGIPFFLDRRESVTHHPLAELTRSALRTVAFDWQHEDWFAGLKAGFSPADEIEIDRLENESLARGWRGAKWTSRLPIPDDPALEQSVERLRRKLVQPFSDLAERLKACGGQPTGAQLASALREFWRNLDVETRLQKWAAEIRDSPQSAIHLTVWEQMNALLDNLELAFPHEGLPLRSSLGIISKNDPAPRSSIPHGGWLPILEAGLASLTVGVIPPALDQVLIGAIDRSRNPDLKLAVVLGLNEGVFPAASAEPILLTDTERDALQPHGVALGPNLRDRLARERYFGYIACTRARQKLVATYSRRDADGKTLNPSPFISHLRRLVPEIVEEEFHGTDDWRDAEHVCELISPLVAMQDGVGRATPCAPPLVESANGAHGVTRPTAESWSRILQIPALAMLRDSLLQLRNPDPAERLSAPLAEKLFGPRLRTSVSRLEEFAACPFRFFVHSGLRAEERTLFELDAREQGSFQHEALKVFHEQLRAEARQWRDLTPRQARERMGRIAAALTANYRDGLLRDTEQSRFTAQVLTASLQDFIEVLVGWMREQYEFEPIAVELEFGTLSSKPTPCAAAGMGSPGLPAWEIDLGAGHKLVLQGRIDRVDLYRERGAETALCVVMDYKSSHKQLDPLLMQHGVQLQLLAYLGVLRHWPSLRPLFGVERLIPAGVFYVNLRGKHERGNSRTEVLADEAAARKLAYRHAGRFDASVVRKLDRRRNASQGDQFNYRLNQNGSVRAQSGEALERVKFEKLLDNVEAQLQAMGARIFAGDAAVDPYRKNGVTPCEQCDYRAICRIDAWTHRYRVLRKEETETHEDR